jgi:hypothetical protein
VFRCEIEGKEKRGREVERGGEREEGREEGRGRDGDRGGKREGERGRGREGGGEGGREGGRGGRERALINDAGQSQPPSSHPPSHLEQIALIILLDLCWRSPESDDLWYKSGVSANKMCDGSGDRR